MSTHTRESNSRTPLRLWPGVTAAVLLVLIRFVLPAAAPEGQIFGADAGLIAVLGGLALALAIIVWWLFFSRAPWPERLIAIGVMILVTVAIRPLTHISIQNGMMGMMFFIYAVPTTLSLAFVFWAVASRGLSERPRRVAMIVAILIGCGVWTLARTDGLLGGTAELQWRWTPTAEELLLAREGRTDPAPDASAVARLNSPAGSGETAPAAPGGGVPAAPVLPETLETSPAAPGGGAPAAPVLPATPETREAPGAPAPAAPGSPMSPVSPQADEAALREEAMADPSVQALFEIFPVEKSKVEEM